MANAEPRTSVVTTTVGRAPVAAPPLAAYRGALARLDVARLRAIAAGARSRRGRGTVGEPARRADRRASRESADVEAVLGRLEHGPRLALCLFALTETTAWPMAGLAQALECLGVEPLATVRALVDFGLLAVATEPGRRARAGRRLERTARARTRAR